jgi:hypothetical protein
VSRGGDDYRTLRDAGHGGRWRGGSCLLGRTDGFVSLNK